MKSNTNNSWLTISLGAIQVVLLAVLIFFVYDLNKEMKRVNDKLSNVVNSDGPPPAPETVNLNDDEGAPAMGSDSAKVVMTVFSDFECGYCKEFALSVLPKLEDEYVKSGKLKVVFRDLPLPMHENAFIAAEAAACANEQGYFWPMHDYLFNNQGKFTVDFFVKWAQSANLNTDMFKHCLEDRHYLKAIESDMMEANAAGIKGTPAIIINGKLILGIRPYEFFAQEIEKNLKSL